MPKRTFIHLFTLLALCAGITLTGCDSGSSEDDAPSIGGTYTATQTVDGTTGTFEITFPNVESGSFDVTGTFSAVQEGVTVSLPVTGDGVYDFPDISMNMTVEAAGSTNSDQVSGTVSNSADLMTLTDSDGASITFRRQ